MQNYLRKGLSFPLARQYAISEICPLQDFSQILEQPNNILGIEYLKALYRLDSKMKPYTIARMSSNYHDTDLKSNFSSATALRQAIACNHLADLYGQIPANSMPPLEDTYQSRYPVFTNDFSLLLKYRLLTETKSTLTRYADVSEELANRIYNQLNNFISFEQFCELLKTKEVTYSRISRALLHILLEIKKANYVDINYVRILGFRKDGSDVLTQIKNKATISLVTKITQQSDSLLDIDIYASNLYESVVTDKFETPFINEYEHKIVII